MRPGREGETKREEEEGEQRRDTGANEYSVYTQLRDRGKWDFRVLFVGSR